MKYICYVLLIVLFCTGYSLSPEWHYYILDKTPAGSINSIVLDLDDRPYILFYYLGGNALTLAHWTGCKWIYEPVSTYEHYGSDSSLAIDKEDNIHASFRDCETDDLMYGYRNSEGWSIYRVDSEDNAGPFNSIAIDSKNYPHIAYCREYNNDKNTELRYAYYDGMNWNIEVIDNEYQEEGYFCSLALDSNDYPHISYMEYFPNSGWNLKYARWDGTKWIKELISSESYDFIYFNTDIVIDSNNRPHIVYRGGYGHKYLYYLYFNGELWNKGIVDYCTGCLSLSLDSNEYPCIAYNSFASVKYAHWDGSKWIIEIAKDKAYLGDLDLSLALDSKNYPHISCDNYITEPYSIYYIWYGEPLVGISLTSFSAKPNNDAITLNWSVTTDVAISGFNLYRRPATPGAIHELPIQTPVGTDYNLSSNTTPVGDDTFHRPDDNTQWTKVNTSLITGTSPYSYTDRTVAPETNYEYKLETVVSDKSETIGTTYATSGNGTPSSFEITSIYPCPANDFINCIFSVPSGNIINISIYDISGRIVSKSFVNVDKPSITEVKINTGELSNGVYILTATTETEIATKRFVIVR